MNLEPIAIGDLVDSLVCTGEIVIGRLVRISDDGYFGTLEKSDGEQVRIIMLLTKRR